MLMSIDQFAERIGVHGSTLRRWLREGRHLHQLPKPLPVKAVGGGPLWLERDVDRWRSERVIGQIPEPAEASRPRLALVR
jgi:transposase